MGVFGAAAVGAVGTLGAAALSSGKGSGGGSSSTTTSQPWAPQGDQLQNVYTQAQNIYNTNTAAGPYTGNFVAGTNAPQQSAITNANNWANGQGGQLPGQVANTASGLMGASGQYVSNANGLASNGITGPNAGLYNTLQSYGTGAQSTQGSALSGALNSAAMSGAGSLQNFQNGMSGVANQAMANPTQQTMANAETYANSPQTQQAINSVNSQIGQTLNEQTVPGLNRQAAMGGSLNSSRAGMAEGMANENAAIAEGNADSQISNNAFNTGLGTAANQYQAGLNTALTANSTGYNSVANNANTNAALQQGLGEFNTGTQVNAANSGLSSNLNYEMGNANTQLGANAQLGTATGLGIQGAASAGNDAAQNFNTQSTAGAQQQSVDQNAINNSYQQWQMNNQYDQNMLNNYNGIVGSGNWGGSSASSQQSQLPPNLLGSAAGGAALGAGLYQNLSGTSQNALYPGGTSTGQTSAPVAYTGSSYGSYVPATNTNDTF